MDIMTDVIEDIAKEFDIPIEDARKRAAHFFGGLKLMTDEERKRKDECMRVYNR